VGRRRKKREAEKEDERAEVDLGTTADGSCGAAIVCRNKEGKVQWQQKRGGRKD